MGVFAPFTTNKAPTVGLTPQLLRGRQVRRELHGAYVEAGLEPSPALSVAAARLVLPADVLLDGVTALQAAGVDVGATRPMRFVSAHPHQVRRPQARVRRVTTLPETSDSPWGASLRPADAFVAASRDLDLVELVAAGDWLVRLEKTTVAELVAAATMWRGRHARHARRAASLVRAGVDSPQETRLRLCLVLAGLPEPEVNPVLLVDGRRVGRVDLLFRRWRLVVEYEGDQHRVDLRQWNVDIGRHEQLAFGTWSLIRVTAARMRHPRAVVAGVVRALRDAGWEGAALVFDEEWHRLFPSAR